MQLIWFLGSHPRITCHLTHIYQSKNLNPDEKNKINTHCLLDWLEKTKIYRAPLPSRPLGQLLRNVSSKLIKRRSIAEAKTSVKSTTRRGKNLQLRKCTV